MIICGLSWAELRFSLGLFEYLRRFQSDLSAALVMESWRRTAHYSLAGARRDLLRFFQRVVLRVIIENSSRTSVFGAFGFGLQIWWFQKWNKLFLFNRKVFWWNLHFGLRGLEIDSWASLGCLIASHARGFERCIRQVQTQVRVGASSASHQVLLLVVERETRNSLKDLIFSLTALLQWLNVFTER